MYSLAAEAAQGDALQRFFKRHFPDAPGQGRVLAIRAHSPRPLEAFSPANVVCLQTNRVLADKLEQRGFPVCVEAVGEFDLCLIEATKHKEENLHHIALAWSLLRPGGHLILSAANALGGESLSRRIAEAAFPIRGTYSLAKCRIIWLSRSGDAPRPDIVAAWLALGSYRRIPGTDLVACPGIFSAGAVDTGTRVLCEALPAPLEGHGADFGAGYGALCRHLLSRSAGIRRLDLYDIERKALAAAELNLAPWRERVELRYHWADVPQAVAGHRFDWIVMNPPFHAGRAAVPALGKSFIDAAAANLKPHGSLWLVANRHLPYEAVLAERFADTEAVGDHHGFKVFRAGSPGKRRR